MEDTKKTTKAKKVFTKSARPTTKGRQPQKRPHHNFSRFVEAGRVAVAVYGPLKDKPVIIVDIIDQNRIIVEGPEVPRQVISTRWVSLSPLVLPHFNRGTGSSALKAILAKNDVIAQWKDSAWGRKIAVRQNYAKLNDFERFKAKIYRRAIKKRVHQLFVVAKKADNKARVASTIKKLKEKKEAKAKGKK